MNQLTPEQESIVNNLAAVLAGLQVPISIAGGQILGAALAPAVELRAQLGIFGWVDKDEVADKLKEKLYVPRD